MVHQRNLLKVVKPIDFHYFGKANEVTFITESALKFFSCTLGTTYFAKSQNSIQSDHTISNANRNWFNIAEVQYMQTLRQIKSREMKNHLI